MKRMSRRERYIKGVAGYAGAFPVDKAPCQKPNEHAVDVLALARFPDPEEKLKAAEEKRRRKAERRLRQVGVRT